MTHIPAPQKSDELTPQTPKPPAPEAKATAPSNPLVGVIRALQNKGKIKGVADLADFEWRTGGSKSRQAKFIYAQLGDSPSKNDPMVGEMYSPILARAVVDDHNGWLD